nr:hypothetical protein CFP56_58748 [Quercus suber]
MVPGRPGESISPLWLLRWAVQESKRPANEASLALDQIAYWSCCDKYPGLGPLCTRHRVLWSNNNLDLGIPEPSKITSPSNALPEDLTDTLERAMTSEAWKTNLVNSAWFWKRMA